MNKVIVLLALLALTYAVKLTDSGTHTKLVNPKVPTVLAHELNTAANQYNNLIPSADWIWKDSGLNSPKGESITAEYLFYASCSGDLTISVAAYGYWKVYLDGV